MAWPLEDGHVLFLSSFDDGVCARGDGGRIGGKMDKQQKLGFILFFTRTESERVGETVRDPNESTTHLYCYGT
jgi:hypothetical protein